MVWHGGQGALLKFRNLSSSLQRSLTTRHCSFSSEAVREVPLVDTQVGGLLLTAILLEELAPRISRQPNWPQPFAANFHRRQTLEPQAAAHVWLGYIIHQTKLLPIP